jgi:hypothetical protein
MQSTFTPGRGCVDTIQKQHMKVNSTSGGARNIAGPQVGCQKPVRDLQ